MLKIVKLHRMIKRILGILATLAILALIVFTALGSGNYKSMLPVEWLESAAEVSADVVITDEPIAEVGEVEESGDEVFPADSLQIDVVE